MKANVRNTGSLRARIRKYILIHSSPCSMIEEHRNAAESPEVVKALSMHMERLCI